MQSNPLALLLSLFVVQSVEDCTLSANSFIEVVLFHNTDVQICLSALEVRRLGSMSFILINSIVFISFLHFYRS